VLWQHGENGKAPGIEGPVDLDVFNGDLEALGRYRIKRPAAN
jgi:GH25 family lysozyme M1 (1,4-beta-N-acetylmuramidase)